MKAIKFFFFLPVFLFSTYQEDLLEYLRPCFFKEGSQERGIEGIDIVYVINLDKETKRWEYMQQCLSAFNLVAVRYSAICGKEIARKELKYFYNRCLYKKKERFHITPGQIGCFLSHLSILKEIVENQINVAWILEDDVTFMKDPRPYLESVLKELNEKKVSWDVIYTDLGSRNKNKDGSLVFFNFESGFSSDFKKGIEEKIKIRGEHFLEIERRFGTYSMIVSQGGAKKILDYFLKNKMEYSYDVDLNFCPGKVFLQTKEDVVSTLGLFGSTTNTR